MLHTLALTCFAISRPAVATALPLGVATKQKSSRIVYVCPPCGQVCDNDIHEKPGVCETCGMKLVAMPYSKAKAGQFKGNGTVLVLIFPGVDIIDFSGPWEVFGMAKYSVYTVAAKPGPVHTSYAQTLTPDYTLDNCPKADILLLPGGNVPTLMKNGKLMNWIKKEVAATPHTMSVCVGSYWLAQCGLLDGKQATTMFPMYDGFHQSFPKIDVVRNVRYVDSGKITTTGGLFAGIDGAFHLMEKLHGQKFAADLAKGGEYRWHGGEAMGKRPN